MEHQNPNLDPPPGPGQNPYHPPPHHQFQYYPHNPNPNPNPILNPNDPLYLTAEPALAPPGVDPYSSSSAPQFSYPAAPQAHYAPPPHSQQQHYGAPAATVSGGGGYYSEAELQGWAALEAAKHFGLDSAASYYAGPVAGHGNGISMPQNGTEQMTYPTPQANGVAFSKRKKPLKKKPKIIQSAYCGICKVDCNSNDILAQHKLGKKHKKNVEKLRQSLAPAPAPAPTPAPAPAPTPAPTTAPAPAPTTTPTSPPPQANDVAGSSDPAIGPQENPEAKTGANPSGKKKKKKKAAGSAMDVESKKRKVLEGGAAAEAVRTCDICNVVCNSETVFSSHVAGQKHTAMVRRHLTRSALL